jgi:hypothetical protein
MENLHIVIGGLVLAVAVLVALAFILLRPKAASNATEQADQRPQVRTWSGNPAVAQLAILCCSFVSDFS